MLSDRWRSSMTSHRPQQEAASPPSCRRSTSAAQPRQQGRGPAPIGRSAQRPRASTTEDVLAAAPGLLDGRIDPADFRVELHDQGGTPARPRRRHRAPRGAGGRRCGPGAAGADRARTGRHGARSGQGKPKAQGGQGEAKPAKAAADDKPTPRAGTKQAQMIEMLKRPEGATVEQIAKATGWQHHTIRGAISGALKKKLGLTVEATRTREVGPNKTGAKGSSTVYRIVGLSRSRRVSRHDAKHRAIGSTRPTAPRPRPCSPSGASARPTSTGRSPSWRAPRAPGPRHRRDQRRRRVRHRPEGWHPDLPDACPSPSSPFSGSRSWSCSAACPRAARHGSSRTAPCRD